MKTSELIVTLVSLGYTTTESYDASVIYVESPSLRDPDLKEGITFKVAAFYPSEYGAVDTTFAGFSQLPHGAAYQLLGLLVKYALTPVNERKTETVYAYFLMDTHGLYKHVNYEPARDVVCINTDSHEQDSRTHFTDSYIESHPTLDAWLEKYADVLDTELIEKGGM